MQTTSQTWKTLWASGAAKLEARATIGGTTYTDEISAPVIRRALMQELPSVGNVVSATCLITLRTSNVIAPSAAVLVEMRLTDGATSSEWLPAGTFYIAKRYRDPTGALLTLECYDALLKANAVWTPSTGSWPRSMSSVTAELATLLGLTQDSRNALAAYTMAEPESGTTIRDALAAIGAANGGSWIVSPAGLLRLVPLRDAATAAAASDAAVVQGVLTNLAYDASTTVTGLRYSVDGAPTLLGTDTGTVIDMGENGAQAQSLYDVVVGMTYQGYSLEGAIYDPAAELGDGLAAGANGEIRSLLCAESITLGPLVSGDVSAPATGGVVDEYPYIGGAANKALIAAKAYANEVTEDLDDSLTQLEIFNRLTDNGAAQGLYLVDGQLYVNASYINAGYLSANRIQGGTLTLGGANDTNGVMQVLDANGNEVVLGNNKGITITKGALIVPIAYQDTGEAGSFVSINGPSGAQIPGVPSRQTDFRAVYAKSANEKYETVIDKGVLSLRNGILTSRYRPPSTDITWDGIEVNTQETQYWGMTINSFEDYDIDEQETAISAPGRIELNTYLLRFTNTGTNTKWFELVPLHMYYSGNVNLSIPLGVASGGTGASTAAGACANLGALPLSGGTMTGNIDMGQAGASSTAKIIQWTTTDGTVFQIRPYNNLFQIVRTPAGGTSISVLNIDSDGNIGGVANPGSWRTALGVYSQSDVDGLVGAKIYSVRGTIVESGTTGTAKGYGKATVQIIGKTVLVDFSAKITTAGTVSDVYNIGISVATLRGINASIPAFTVGNGGNITFFDADGKYSSMNGYAGEAAVNTSGNYWSFARVYNTSGSVGAWADRSYQTGMVITGTLQGVLD